MARAYIEMDSSRWPHLDYQPHFAEFPVPTWSHHFLAILSGSTLRTHLFVYRHTRTEKEGVTPVKKSFWIVFLGLALVTPAYLAQAQSSKSKVSALSKTLNKVKSQRSQLQKKLSDKKKETKKMMNDIHRVDDQLENLEIVMEQTEQLLQKSRKEQAELRVKLQKSTEKLDQVKGKVRTRLRSIYTQGKSTPISILVGTQSVSDLASRKALIQRIADRDRELFEEVKVLRDEVLNQKKEQDRIVANIAGLINDQVAKKSELESKRQERKKIFDVLWAQKDELEKEFAAFEKENVLRVHHESGRG